MGLFRVATVVAVGVALLPSDRTQQELLYVRTASAAKWTLTFCERNENTCTQAVGVWEQFKTKAQFGAKLAYDMAHENQEPVTAVNAPVQTGSIKRVNGTLTDADLKPEWRGRAGRAAHYQ